MPQKVVVGLGAWLSLCCVAALASGDPPSKPGVAEAPLPKGAKLRLRQKRHVKAVAFSPDGKVLACGGKDICLWDPTTWKVRRRLEQPEVVALAFGPRGSAVMAAGNSGETVLWDTSRGVALHRLRTPGLNALALSPDGKVLATAQEGRGDRERPRFTLWEAGSGKTIRVLETDHKGYLTGVAFLPDGKTLVTACTYDRPGVRLWDVASGELRSEFDAGWANGAQAIRRAIAVAPDGKTLAIARRGGTSVWDLSGPKPREKQFPGMPEKRPRWMGDSGVINDSRVQSLAFSPPNGRLLAVLQIDYNAISNTDGGSLVLAEMLRGEAWKVYYDIKVGRGDALAFAPDGRTFVTAHSAGPDSQLLVWDVPAAQLPRWLQWLRAGPDKSRK